MKAIETSSRVWYGVCKGGGEGEVVYEAKGRGKGKTRTKGVALSVVNRDVVGGGHRRLQVEWQSGSELLEGR